MTEHQLIDDEEIHETVPSDEELPIFRKDLEAVHTRLQDAIDKGDLGGIQNAAADLSESIRCSHLRAGRTEEPISQVG